MYDCRRWSYFLIATPIYHSVDLYVNDLVDGRWEWVLIWAVVRVVTRGLCSFDEVFCSNASVRVSPKIAQVFIKVPDITLLVSHNGIFLFMRSQLTVRVMYWARVEDYFYPFHGVCMHLLYTPEAASQSSSTKLLSGAKFRRLWMIGDLKYNTYFERIKSRTIQYLVL